MPGILEGVKVLDISRYIAGPFCAKTLADMGADVIRVEEPGGADDRFLGPFAPNGEALMAASLNCNKRGITLNLNSPEGKEILTKLLKWADIFIESFSVPAKKSLGFTYPELKAINENLILISISGYGFEGPFADYLGFDSSAQAETGMMMITGHPAASSPTRMGISMVDFNTATYAALSAVLALYHRSKAGVSQKADIALLDVATAMNLGYALAGEYKILGRIRQPRGLQAYFAYACGFKAKDGWVYLSATTVSIWKRFCKLLGREDLLDNPELKDDELRWENHHLVDPIVEEWLSEKNVDEVLDILRKNRIPCGPIDTPEKVLYHPQVKERQMIINMEHPGVGELPLPGVVIKLSETPGHMERRAPKVGEHNADVYQTLLGCSADEVEALREKGIC